MCGIFGAKDYKQYTQLYNMNKKRGTYAFGGILVTKSIYATLRSPGKINLTRNLVIKYGRVNKKIYDFDYFLGHTQAPTSSARKYSIKTSHPFNTENWVVAHNGVLTNHLVLKKPIRDKKLFNEVDSSVIPVLLHLQRKKFPKKTEAQIICSVLSVLEGNFGLWIYNSKNQNIYIARSGCTLYADFLNNSFSSLTEKGFKPIDEGILYLLTPEGITEVCEFKASSPFFTK